MLLKGSLVGVEVLKTRVCLECKNFEDRGEIDNSVVCAKGHTPKIACPEFQDKFEGSRGVTAKTRFCYECENFEDRGEIDETVLCAKGHEPGVSCPDFEDRRVNSERR